MEYLEKEHDVNGEIFDNLNRIRRFSGPPAEFWLTFLEWSAVMAGARLALLLAQMEDGSWKRLSEWPTNNDHILKALCLESTIEEIAEAAALKGFAWENPLQTKEKQKNGALIGARLKLEEEDRASVAVLLLDNESGPGAQEAAMRLMLVADTPAVYQLARMVRQAKMDVVHFSEALDLMVLLNDEKRYLSAAMTFCNEIASRYKCERTSLGWLRGAYVRLQAISHMERFEKKMDAVQALESAMEETFDQDEEIVFPGPKGRHYVARDHEAFSKGQGASHLASLPIRLDNKPVGVVTCERSSGPFSVNEVRGLRVLCDLAARRLGDLKRNDRWFGAKIATSLKESLSKFFGVEHTFAKLMGFVIALALVFLVFGKWSYRVEAPFMLKTDDLAYLPAPFDGYIQEVHIKVGDYVNKQGPLLSLDTRELLIEESTAISNQNRYLREAEKARAQNALADMKIALAMEAQAMARLKMVRYHLDHAQLKAPFAGIVVEGDLEELLGAPVKKGDVLFKVARIEKMYVELKVDERDIHEVATDATGEIAFVSRPHLKFPIKVQRIDPVAIAEEEGNVFVVRALFTEEVNKWWRPGMSGVAKINVGKRNILWVLTHRTIDFFRILLWW